MKQIRARITELLSILILTISVFNSLADENNSNDVTALRQQIEALAQKVKVLELKEDGTSSAATGTPATGPKSELKVSENGVEFQSADKNFDLQLHGLLDVDTRLYMSPDSGPGTSSNSTGQANNNTGDSGIYLRRVRPIISGTFYLNFEFNITTSSFTKVRL